MLLRRFCRKWQWHFHWAYDAGACGEAGDGGLIQCSDDPAGVAGSCDACGDVMCDDAACAV